MGKNTAPDDDLPFFVVLPNYLHKSPRYNFKEPSNLPFSFGFASNNNLPSRFPPFQQILIPRIISPTSKNEQPDYEEIHLENDVIKSPTDSLEFSDLAPSCEITPNDNVTVTSDVHDISTKSQDMKDAAPLAPDIVD